MSVCWAPMYMRHYGRLCGFNIRQYWHSFCPCGVTAWWRINKQWQHWARRVTGCVSTKRSISPSLEGSILQPFWKGLTWLVQAHWHSRGRSYIYLPCVLNLWATLEFCLAPALGDNRSYGYRKFSAKGAQRRPIFYPLNLRQALE